MALLAQKFAHRSVGLWGALALLLAVGFTSSVSPAADAGEPCTCVTYLKAGLGLIPGGVWNAKDYGPTLESIGFKRLDRPKRGAIMIFRPWVRGANDPAGHIALVTDTSYDAGSNSWTVTVQHAKWTVGTAIPGAGPCPSARLTTFSGITSHEGLSFYKRS